MSTLILTASLFLGSHVGLLIVDNAGARATPELQEAALKQVQALEKNAQVELRVAKRASACNIEDFHEDGVTFEHCKVLMPRTLEKTYVVELKRVGDGVESTVAMFDSNELVYPARTHATLYSSSCRAFVLAAELAM